MSEAVTVSTFVDNLNTFRGLTCERQTHTQTHTRSQISSLKFALQTKRKKRNKEQANTTPYPTISISNSDDVDTGSHTEVFLQRECAWTVAEGGSVVVVHHIHNDRGTDCLLQEWIAFISDAHLPLK